MEFLAFQQFEPRERKTYPNCIWCGGVALTNRAHVISRKLTTSAQNAPTLRFNVCEVCNAKCGNLEEWILRFTPLSWVRFMLYLSPGSRSTTRHVPSYFFSTVINDWVIFHLDGISHSYDVSTQHFLAPNSGAILITEMSPESQEHLSDRIKAAFRDKAFKIVVHASLPANFSPHVLLDGEQILLIARTDIEAQAFNQHVSRVDWRTPDMSRMRLGNTSQEQHHFRWSKTNWARFCAKMALEALCLFEGGEKCLRPAFGLVRNFVTRGEIQSGREIVFDEKGPRSIQDVPAPVSIDLTLGQAAPKPIAALLPHAEAGMHIVSLYEIHGWVLASIVIAGFPPSVLVLGGPDEHLADIYQLIYDDETSTFDFVRLAYDQVKPIVPIAVSGDSFSDLVETYGLKAI